MIALNTFIWYEKHSEEHYYTMLFLQECSVFGLTLSFLNRYRFRENEQRYHHGNYYYYYYYRSSRNCVKNNGKYSGTSMDNSVRVNDAAGLARCLPVCLSFISTRGYIKRPLLDENNENLWQSILSCAIELQWKWYIFTGLKNIDKRKHAITVSHVDVILKFLPFWVPFPSSTVDLLTCPSDSYHQLIHSRTSIIVNKSKHIPASTFQCSL